MTHLEFKRARVMANRDFVERMLGWDNDAFLKRDEVASVLSISVSAVANLSYAGTLSCVHTLGGHSRYRVGEVRRFLREQWGVLA